MRATLLLLTFVISLLPPVTQAQDREGRDTAGAWRPTYQETYGIWRVVCDERDRVAGVEGDVEPRCYIRYVDVFSPAPAFAAQFMFITPETGGLRVEFGTEPGTRFTNDGFRIEDWVGIQWSTQNRGCLFGGECVFEGDAAIPLLDAMRDQGALRFTFTDRHGSAQDLSWPLTGFDSAFSDFLAQSDARGLPYLQ
ncbi:invasion associated locus B family protein [Cochlodiniinecator piscidefendens]|uniref:hypothetical protein n=1 Tax=Cochlodiniinecator piscidefendens TaxID=2715756 RepID=UPI00140B43C1|nr:hypothetical protein [Cochlodiniinecator piscidefendens]